MNMRCRTNVPDDPVDERHVDQSSDKWAQFNLARRICQMKKKEARQLFVANLRFKETPEFVGDLEREVRRQWPLRNQQTHVWLQTFERTPNGN